MKEIIFSACGAWVWVYILGMIRFKYKPLNCEKCLAGWFCLAFTAFRFPWYEVPFMMACSMVLVLIINKLV